MGGGLKFAREYINNKKWKGKGYDNLNIIVYELNDGKGFVIEYWCGRLNFLDEYLNGKRNGKGKVYDSNGKLESECEYLNGKRKAN